MKDGEWTTNGWRMEVDDELIDDEEKDDDAGFFLLFYFSDSAISQNW